MATSVPAAALGLSGRKGTLRPGADADVVLLDDEARAQLPMVAGAWFTLRRVGLPGELTVV